MFLLKLVSIFVVVVVYFVYFWSKRLIAVFPSVPLLLGRLQSFIACAQKDRQHIYRREAISSE